MTKLFLNKDRRKMLCVSLLVIAVVGIAYFIKRNFTDVGTCKDIGDTCATNDDCCAFNCQDSVCKCLEKGHAGCKNNDDCCGVPCVFNKLTGTSTCQLIGFGQPGCRDTDDCDGNALCLESGVLGSNVNYCGGRQLPVCLNMIDKDKSASTAKPFYQCARATGVTINGKVYNPNTASCSEDVDVLDLNQFCNCPDNMECVQGCGIPVSGYCRKKVMDESVCSGRNALDYFCCTAEAYKCCHGLCKDYDCNTCRQLAACTTGQYHESQPPNTFCPSNGDPGCDPRAQNSPSGDQNPCFVQGWSDIYNYGRQSTTDFTNIGPQSTQADLDSFKSQYMGKNGLPSEYPCMGAIDPTLAPQCFNGTNPDFSAHCYASSDNSNVCPCNAPPQAGQKESFGDDDSHCLASNVCCLAKAPDTTNSGCPDSSTTCSQSALLTDNDSVESKEFKLAPGCTSEPGKKSAWCNDEGYIFTPFNETWWCCPDTGCTSDKSGKINNGKEPQYGCYGLLGYTPGDDGFNPLKYCPPCKPEGMDPQYDPPSETSV